MKKSILKYRYNEDLEFNVEKPQIITILGNSNNRILNNLLWNNKKGNIFVDELEVNDANFYKYHQDVSFILYKQLNIFIGETVSDEIAFGLESLGISRNDIHEIITREARIFNLTDKLEKDPNSLGSNDKALVKILSAMIINPKIIVLENILSELDYEDYEKIKKIFNEYIKKGGTIINITNNVEEALIGSRTIVVCDMKVVCDDKTAKVMTEEKLLKRLGIGLPFIIELNKYLIDYALIDKYYMDYGKMVKEIWK